MKTDRMKMIIGCVVFLLLVGVQFSHGQVYKWVDEKGTVHFTEDPATIPDKYRDRTKTRIMEEDRSTPEPRKDSGKQEERTRDRSGKDSPGSQPVEKKQVEKPRGECTIKMVGETRKKGSNDGIETCVSMVIKNGDLEPKTITERNVIGVTLGRVPTRYKERHTEPRNPLGPVTITAVEYNNRFTPKPFRVWVNPGETYEGEICFEKLSIPLPIYKLELHGL